MFWKIGVDDCGASVRVLISMPFFLSALLPITAYITGKLGNKFGHKCTPLFYKHCTALCLAGLKGILFHFNIQNPETLDNKGVISDNKWKLNSDNFCLQSQL